MSARCGNLVLSVTCRRGRHYRSGQRQRVQPPQSVAAGRGRRPRRRGQRRNVHPGVPGADSQGSAVRDLLPGACVAGVLWTARRTARAKADAAEPGRHFAVREPEPLTDAKHMDLARPAWVVGSNVTQCRRIDRGTIPAGRPNRDRQAHRPCLVPRLRAAPHRRPARRAARHRPLAHPRPAVRNLRPRRHYHTDRWLVSA